MPSHGTNRGSNPLRDAKEINNLTVTALGSVQYMAEYGREFGRTRVAIVGLVLYPFTP